MAHEQILCWLCDLPIKKDDPTKASTKGPQHAICADISEAHNQACIENYVANHGCTSFEACVALFPEMGWTAAQWEANVATINDETLP